MKVGRPSAGTVLWAGALSLMVVAMTACTSGTGNRTSGGSGGTQGQTVHDASALAGSHWQVSEIGGIASDPGVPSTLAFEPPGRVSGNGGCNRFSGVASVGDGSIRLGPLAATRMACPPPRMEQESRYFAALAKAVRWQIDNDSRLALADDAGAVLVTFDREKL